MPHVVVQYAAALDADHDLQALCDALFAALAAHPAIPDHTTLKVRAVPCPHSHIGTEPASFAHADLALLPGRDPQTLADLAETVLAAMRAGLPGVGSLSVDVRDLSAAYRKHVL